MKIASIAFVDAEIEPKTGKVLDLGSVKNNNSHFHKNSIKELTGFLKGTDFLCGHNIFDHDIKYIEDIFNDSGINKANIIDTLFLSPLLFPNRPYHSLLKDDKLQTDEKNNPLNDAIKAKDLFFDEVLAFQRLDETFRQVLYLLLGSQKEFCAFFSYLSYASPSMDLEKLIRQKFEHDICGHAELKSIISDSPIELAYCLSLISTKNQHSITPPWVLRKYPAVEKTMSRLRNKPCLLGCPYCSKALDIYIGLKKYFGFDSFRTYGGEPLQEKAALAAINNKSLLAVFPTGGGKSITFQLPALMIGENTKGLTVVISPLQSLMKDQVDNLEKNGITNAVTINGLLNSIERAKSLERIEEGSASILYISPESLRSRTIEHLLLGRKIARFVIDEAHCFSSWGQDFRVDYLYIGDFIKSIQEKKRIREGIPVSCFTATAKLKVIEDIQSYFKEKLSLDLELFTSKASRSNLKYEVFERAGEQEKYQSVRDLIEAKNCPTIVYVARTKMADSLALRLNEDGFKAGTFHGKLDPNQKTAHQNAFITGEISIMVATSAFGMGVDKKDIGMVIHYDISDSLENYVQEAGRAGRDEKLIADCYILFNEDDLSKHFALLNQTRLSIKEIQQIWKAIKEVTKFRSTISNSALEIARQAGWDDNILDIETRVTTAIAALEESGYLKRKQNMPRVFANSILSKTTQEAIDKINASQKIADILKTNAIRIIKKLFSSKRRSESNGEEAESRIDYISDHLGIPKEEVINIINLLRAENILADTHDLTAFISHGESHHRSAGVVDTFSSIEDFLLGLLKEGENVFHLKKLIEQAAFKGLTNVTPAKIKTVFNFWAIKNWIKKQNYTYSNNRISIAILFPLDILKSKLQRRQELAAFIINYLYKKSKSNKPDNNGNKSEILVEFSVHELKEAYDNDYKLFKLQIEIHDVEDTLFYLSKIESIKIEGGFLVLYNRLTIERIEQNNKKQYTREDYQKLNQFYESKVQQIHIVGEYAKRMITDYKNALQFVDDYFQLNHFSFIKKYFPGSKADQLKLKITPLRFRQLFGDLSPAQLRIINDTESKYIVVAAGPGSGKTRLLVHKLASLLLMEDVKHEQLLMVTFSRAAATEFKTRLYDLIGPPAYFIEIKTFHSYCFDLLGRIGSIEKSDEVIKETVQKIKNKDIEPNQITKTVLVIDEAQDMDENEFGLINSLIDKNENMQVIAVGDDDQNIYEFRGSSSAYLKHFIYTHNATKYELVENYRSKNNLVDFANQLTNSMSYRLKDSPTIAIQPDNGKIKIIWHEHSPLIIPLVSNLLATDLSGTTCILTSTNEEALQITGLLKKRGIHARLIQTNELFKLNNILEVRYFLDQLNSTDNSPIIDNEIWENQKRDLKQKFRQSRALEFIENIIRRFESAHPNKKYKSDLEVFIRESKLEDFIDIKGEAIFVSTIHKVKGKEFDNVFLVLNNFKHDSDESKRVLYVAVTRAKKNLVIHTNSNFLNNIYADNLIRMEDRNIYPPPALLAMHLTLTDVWLDYFINRQSLVSQLLSGEELFINGYECLNARGQSVLKFSRAFIEKITDRRKNGYELTSVKVNFIVYWHRPEDPKQEIKIILPEVWFERRSDV